MKLTPAQYKAINSKPKIKRKGLKEKVAASLSQRVERGRQVSKSDPREVNYYE